jgi:hypothetical protein
LKLSAYKYALEALDRASPRAVASFLLSATQQLLGAKAADAGINQLNHVEHRNRFGAAASKACLKLKQASWICADQGLRLCG